MTERGNHILALKEFVKSPYAWPGGYPLYAVTEDGAALCAVCCKKELGLIVTSISQNLRDGWQVEDIGINYEDPDLYCAHCNNRIESAYCDEN